MTETFVTDKLGRKVIGKDPNAKKDYSFDFSRWLDADNDTIASQTVTVDTASGVVVEAVNVTANKVVTVWLSGGTVGKEARVTCHIVTNGGRQDDRTFYLNIEQK